MSQELIGAQLGQYRIERLLGKGGFAEVYLGEHTYLKTPAAIKLLYSNKQDTQDFLREARLLASLKHPHIVPVFEFDLYEGRPFLVMEYMPNGTLRQRHPYNSRLQIETILAYFKQIGAALSYLHQRQVAHGDVKPENMLVGAQGELHLSDFGIATLASRQQQQGLLVGTIDYMAPEQLQHQLISASDQYALGIIAYEWLCGAPPFRGSYAEIATQHVLTPAPSLREGLPDLPEVIDQVILRALAKEPEQRFPDVNAFVSALEAAHRNAVPTIYGIAPPPSASAPLTLPTEPAPQAKSSRRAVLVGSVAALSVAGAGGLFWWIRSWHNGEITPSSNSAQTPTTTHMSQPTSAPRSGKKQGDVYYVYQKQTDAITALTWSPDSKRIVSASGASEYLVHVWDAQSGNNLVIYQKHTATIKTLAWSPDGKYIASGGDGDPPVHVWEAATGKQVATFKQNFDTVDQLYWLSTNQLLVATTTGLVTKWQPFAATSAEQLFDKQSLNAISIKEGWGWVVSPNGNYVVTLTNTATPENATVYSIPGLRNISSCDVSTAVEPAGRGFYWSPNSQLIVTTPARFQFHVWKAQTGQPITAFFGGGDPSSLSWSPDNTTFVTSYIGNNTSTALIQNPTTGKRQYEYIAVGKDIQSMAWSPNGQMLACGAQGTTEVWQAI